MGKDASGPPEEAAGETMGQKYCAEVGLGSGIFVPACAWPLAAAADAKRWC